VKNATSRANIRLYPMLSEVPHEFPTQIFLRELLGLVLEMMERDPIFPQGTGASLPLECGHEGVELEEGVDVLLEGSGLESYIEMEASTEGEADKKLIKTSRI
jgi:hypothetical protein